MVGSIEVEVDAAMGGSKVDTGMKKRTIVVFRSHFFETVEV
jgi:hypothetical protein